MPKIKIKSIELNRAGSAIYDETGRIIGWNGVVLKITLPKGGVIYYEMQTDKAMELGKDILSEVDFIGRFKPVSPEQHEIDKKRRREEIFEESKRLIKKSIDEGQEFSPEQIQAYKDRGYLD